MVCLLELSNIYAGYGKREVLEDVSLKINKGEKFLLIGPNGSGKSTLLKAILGIVKINKGVIKYKGENISIYSTYKIVNKGISYLPQTKNIFPSLTVNENLRLSCFFEDDNFFNDRKKFIFEIFPFLKEKENKRSGLLSGGERQALAMSMALMKNPDLLIIDEPTVGLAPKAAKNILYSLKQIQEKKDFSLIIVEHNIKYLEGMFTDVIIMKEGKIVKKTKKISKKDLETYFF